MNKIIMVISAISTITIAAAVVSLVVFRGRLAAPELEPRWIAFDNVTDGNVAVIRELRPAFSFEYPEGWIIGNEFTSITLYSPNKIERSDFTFGVASKGVLKIELTQIPFSAIKIDDLETACKQSFNDQQSQFSYYNSTVEESSGKQIYSSYFYSSSSPQIIGRVACISSSSSVFYRLLAFPQESDYMKVFDHLLASFEIVQQ